MNETNLKTEGPIALPAPASSAVRASRRAISVGAAGFFALAVWGAIDVQANTLKGKATEKEKEIPIPVSVFVVPANLKEGRNPFFPHSTRGMMQQAPVNPTQPVADISDLVLNGIIPNGPLRTAMINGRTFEAGEEGEVKLPDGQKLLVKVDEIKDDSVVVSARGQRRELHLRSGL